MEGPQVFSPISNLQQGLQGLHLTYGWLTRWFFQTEVPGSLNETEPWWTELRSSKRSRKAPKRTPTWFQLLTPTRIRFQLQTEVVLSDRNRDSLVVSWGLQGGLVGTSCLGLLPSGLGSCQRKRQSLASLRPGGCLDWSLVGSWGPILGDSQDFVHKLEFEISKGRS